MCVWSNQPRLTRGSIQYHPISLLKSQVLVKLIRYLISLLKYKFELI
jgi:hypothetical protein